MKSVYVLDDHDIVRFALADLLDSSGLMKLAGSAASLAVGIREIAELQPDLVITDMSMDDSKGLDTVRAVVEAQRGRGVLVVSMHDELLYAEQVLSLGASGYLMKENAHGLVLNASLEVMAGRSWVSTEVKERLLARLRQGHGASARTPAAAVRLPNLTMREMGVLEKLGKGKTTKEIAFELDLSVRTVDIYRSNLKRKLGLRTGAELIAYSLSHT